MLNKVKFLLFFVIIMGFSITANADSLQYIKSGEYNTHRLTVKSYNIGVITIKNRSNASLNLYIFNESNLNQYLDKIKVTSHSRDICLIDYTSENNTYLIVVENNSYYDGRYLLYTHENNWCGIGFSTLAWNTFSYIIEKTLENEPNADENDQENMENIEEAMTIFFGLLENKDYDEINMEIMIDDIKDELQDQLGYGFWGEFLVDYSEAMIRDIYKFYFD